MALAITVPDEMEVRLRQEAGTQQRAVEEVALDLLNEALGRMNGFAAAENTQQVVASIRATASRPRNVRPGAAPGALAAALRSVPDAAVQADASDFDRAQWDRNWAAVEAEMRAMTRANDAAEGRVAGKAA